MPEAWGLGQVVTTIRETTEDNTRLGRAFVLFGVLAFVGGVGILALTETFRMSEVEVWTYQRFAGVLVGVGLPVFLYGFVALVGGDERAIDVSGLGVLLCALGLLTFLAIATGQGSGGSILGIVAMVLYGLGIMTCSFATGVAVLTRLNTDDEPDVRSDETGFVWGSPPES
ncbi:MAG: hypothetical protein R3324_04950 [Halobacteriales archaeon]|nr:hypothetical protein [Halobacteriales archaeon]